MSGDLVRATAITFKRDHRASLVLSVLIDKVAMLSATASFALLGTLASSRETTGLAVLHALILGLLVASLVLLGVLCWLRVERPSAILSSQKVFPRLKGWRPIIFSKLSKLPRLSYITTLEVLGMSLTLQFFFNLGSYVLARSMSIAISPIDWAAINGIVALGQLLPISLGGLGVREGLFAGLLAPYGYPAVQSTAYSLTGFAIERVARDRLLEPYQLLVFGLSKRFPSNDPDLTVPTRNGFSC